MKMTLGIVLESKDKKVAVRAKEVADLEGLFYILDEEYRQREGKEPVIEDETASK